MYILKYNNTKSIYIYKILLRQFFMLISIMLSLLEHKVTSASKYIFTKYY